jgi:hypothetical protein
LRRLTVDSQKAPLSLTVNCQPSTANSSLTN